MVTLTASLAISITLYIVSTSLVILRISSEWARAAATRPALISLLCALAAWVFLTAAYTCSFIVMTQPAAPAGPHLPLLLKAGWATALTTITSTWLVKASFLAMFFQLSAHVSTALRRLLWGIAAALTTTYLASTISFLTWCGGTLPLLDVTALAPGYCNPTAFSGDPTHLVIGSALNIATDIAIMAAPLLVLRTLRIGPRESLAVAFLLLLGASTITMITVRTVITATTVPAGETGLPMLLNNAELATQLAAVCLPALRARVRVATEAVLGSREGRSAKRSGYRVQEEDGIALGGGGGDNELGSVLSMGERPRLQTEHRDFRPVR
ncbi:hypothetical protein EDC01DRAFT_656923 [Geopyxis carbonaria]|nr:hypothetical protein EDC01DRAFT_656923 [Geopyxis carbonaria]